MADGKQTAVAEVVRVDPETRIARVEDLFRLAIDQKLPAAELEKIADVYERVSDRAAAQEFADALARFQSECPPIPKSRTAKIATRGGGSFSYTFADLDTIERTIRATEHECGLSHTWDSETRDGRIYCECIVTHVNGHSRASKFSCTTDSASGASPQQKEGAALMYARRQTLVMALGLVATDEDTDGAPPTDDRVTSQQAEVLCSMAEEVGADIPKFLKYMQVDDFGQIYSRDYDRALSALKRKAQEAKK